MKEHVALKYLKMTQPFLYILLSLYWHYPVCFEECSKSEKYVILLKGAFHQTDFNQQW